MQVTKTALINLAAFIWFCGGGGSGCQRLCDAKGCLCFKPSNALEIVHLFLRQQPYSPSF